MLLKRHDRYPHPTTPARLSDLDLYPPSYLFTRDSSFIKTRYGIAIGSGPKDRQDDQVLEIEGAGPLAAAQCAALLREELAKYPPQYIKSCGVPRIRVVSSLKTPRDGKENQMHSVGGTASADGSIYVVHDSNDLPHVRDMIHHELLHVSDRPRLRSPFSMLTPLMCLLWIRNNPPQAYIRDKYFDLSLEEKKAIDISGFAAPYGRFSSREDRATVAEGLMTDTTFFYLRGKSDRVLGQKIKLAMLDYWLKSGGLMDRGYFNDLAKGRVDESYWDNKLSNETQTHTSFFSRPSSTRSLRCFIKSSIGV